MDTSLLRKALCSDVALFLKGHTCCWSHHLLKQCQQVGMLPGIGRLELEHLTVDSIMDSISFNGKDVVSKVSQFYEQIWLKEAQGSPHTDSHRDASSDSKEVP